MTVVSNSIDRFVGMRLRSQRERLRFSRKQFARELGIAEDELSDYENGDIRLSALLLQRAAGQLDVPLSFFFRGMEIVSVTPIGASAPASPEAA
jgi:transcriptional regulator with XRE-family HTH domain